MSLNNTNQTKPLFQCFVAHSSVSLSHSQQIQRLSSRIDSHAREGNQKEHTLTEAVAGLTEAKMELKRQEQRLRNLQRQLQVRSFWTLS